MENSSRFRILALLGLVLVSLSTAWQIDNCPAGYSYYNGHECGARIVPLSSVVIEQPMNQTATSNPIYEYDHSWWKTINGPQRRMML